MYTIGRYFMINDLQGGKCKRQKTVPTTEKAELRTNEEYVY